MFNFLRQRIAAAIVAFLAFAVVTNARAGDFQPKRVSADANWLAFVNLEGLLQSTLGKYMLEHGDDLGFEIDDMQDVEAQIGINPMKDIRSVTIYGEGNPEDHKHFVALFDTTAAIDDTIAQFTAGAQQGEGQNQDNEQGDITTVDINGQKVHVMSDGEETTYVAVRPGPISDSRLVIVTMDRDWMSKGLSVLDGKAAGLDRTDKPQVKAAPDAGTLMFVSASDLSWIDIGDDDDDEHDHDNAHQAAHSAIMKAAKGIEIAYGETGADTFINARLETGSADDAQNLSDIMRGLVAMARYAANQDDELKPLLAPTRSLQMKTDGATISMSLKHSTQGIIDALTAMQAEEHGDEHHGEVEIKAGVKLHGHQSKDKDDDAKGKSDDDKDQ